MKAPGSTSTVLVKVSDSAEQFLNSQQIIVCTCLISLLASEIVGVWLLKLELCHNLVASKPASMKGLLRSQSSLHCCKLEIHKSLHQEHSVRGSIPDVCMQCLIPGKD